MYDNSMFSDTHCHLASLCERGIDIKSVLQELVDDSYMFVLDIGTKADDLPARIEFINEIIDSLPNDEQKNYARKMISFSAGIWPAVEAIEDRNAQIKTLQKNIETYSQYVCALGECGLDRFWNKCDGNAGRSSGFLHAEAELFEMQLESARLFNLPVIVHSRDSADETLQCLKNMGWHRGVIHCYSYGVSEAKKFLDEGWYISLSGSITYAKKSQINDTEKLIQYIPHDRLLLETDAPFLAPVPYRGKPNTPCFVKYVYRFVGNFLGMSDIELSNLVFHNTKKLFFPTMM